MSISVIVVTRDRANLLRNCLKSLEEQNVPLSQVVVVDNNSGDETKEVVDSFKKAIPIKYIFEAEIGVPFARNKGLAEAEAEIVAFIDDDCLASPSWIREMKRAFEQFPNATFIIGKTLAMNKGNIYTDLISLEYRRWLRRHVNFSNKRLYDGSVFDTKNVAVKKNHLVKKKILFDPRFTHPLGEDTDLGKQIYASGLKGRYWPRMNVYHLEPANLFGFLSRSFRRGRSYYVLEKKWGRLFQKKKRKMTFKRRVSAQNHRAQLLLKIWKWFNQLGYHYEKLAETIKKVNLSLW